MRLIIGVVIRSHCLQATVMLRICVKLHVVFMCVPVCTCTSVCVVLAWMQTVLSVVHKMFAKLFYVLSCMCFQTLQNSHRHDVVSDRWNFANSLLNEWNITFFSLRFMANFDSRVHSPNHALYPFEWYGIDDVMERIIETSFI